MKESLTEVKLSFLLLLDLLNPANYFFLVNNALIFAPRVLKKFPIAVKPFFNATPKSAKVFFLTANQKIANPPIPATATEPITIPAIAPPESPSFLSGVGVIAPPVTPPPEDLSSYTAVRVVSPFTRCILHNFYAF